MKVQPQYIYCSSLETSPVEKRAKESNSPDEVMAAKNIEFQRVHRLGKPKNNSENGGRAIIARFLRFSDKEEVFK